MPLFVIRSLLASQTGRLALNQMLKSEFATPIRAHVLRSDRILVLISPKIPNDIAPIDYKPT
jgi:hypothetical protein